MFDFFLVHWLLFALLFSFVCISMIFVAVLLERKRIARLQALNVATVSNVNNATQQSPSTN